MIKFLLSFFRKTRAPSISPSKVSSWSEILPKKTSVVRDRRVMLLPVGKAIIWKTENEKKKGSEGINVLFDVRYEDKMVPINIKRPFNQKLVDTFHKMQAIIIKKIGKDEAGNSIFKGDSKFEIGLNVEIEKIETILDLYENLDVTEMYVLDNKYEIIRKTPPSMDFGLTMIPMTNSVIMARFKSYELAPKYHWYVHKTVGSSFEHLKKPKKQGDVDLKFKFLDENMRTFSLDHFEFRSTGRFFEAKNEDIGKLIAIVFDSGPDLPVHGVISTQVIQEGPSELVTDSQIEWCLKTKKPEDDSIRVMTYNILADLYLKLNVNQEDLFFKYCEKTLQRAIYRLPLILRQYKGFIEGGVQLIFLQEVDFCKVFKYHIPFFEHYNFKLEFARKRFMVNEGVGIAFDLNRFKLIKSECYGLHEFANWPENEDIVEMLKSSEECEKKLTTRPTIVQIVVLEDLRRNDNEWIICANTHLHHNPADEHIKLLQSVIAIRIIARIKNELSRDSNKTIRVIFGGDFNSIPEGPVFEFMTNGSIDKTHLCWNLDSKLEGKQFEYPNNMKLLNLTGTPKYTNYTYTEEHPGFAGCLDYIWAQGFTNQSICPLPDHSIIVKFGALPSPISPSDHIPLISDLIYGSSSSSSSNV